MLMELLLSLAIIIFATKLAGHYCYKIGVPAVIGELLVGVLLGPALLGFIGESDIISLFSSVGVILLMFLAGLESDLDKLKKYLIPSVTVALFGILFPMLFMSLTAHFFHLSIQESLFVGIIFSATSVSISVQVLKEYKRVDSCEGSTILGAAIVDDIAVVLIISIFTALVDTNSSDSFNALFLVKLIGTKFLFLAGLWVFARYLLEPLIALTKRIVAVEVETSFALVLCFIFAYLSETVGMSDVIGAFFIGLVLSNQKGKEKIEKSVSTIGYSLFIPVFFVSIGLDVTLSVFKDEWFLILLLTILATLTKLIGGYLGARLTGLTVKESHIVGAGMVSRGEMALIIVKIGNSMNLVDGTLYSVIIVSIILTTLLSPFLIKHAIER